MQAGPEHSFLSIRVMSAALGGLAIQIIMAPRIRTYRSHSAFPVSFHRSPAASVLCASHEFLV